MASWMPAFAGVTDLIHTTFFLDGITIALLYNYKNIFKQKETTNGKPFTKPIIFTQFQ
jgi:hypothetical protein